MRKTIVLMIMVLVPAAVFAQTAGPVQSVSITLSSTQIASLRGTPVTLIAAPGPGKVISPISLAAQYKVGTTPYAITSGGNLNFSLGPLGNSEIAFEPVGGSGFIDQTTNQLNVRSGASIGDAQSKLENQDLRVTNDGSAEWAGGDGTVTITITYTVVTLQ